jgi:hypothetical protein
VTQTIQTNNISIGIDLPAASWADSPGYKNTTRIEVIISLQNKNEP